MAGLKIRGTTVAGKGPAKWGPGRVVCLSQIKSVCLVKNKARFLYKLVCASSKSTELGV